MAVPPEWLVHEARVEPFEGSGAYGDQYGAAYTLPCFYLGVRQLVRARDGSETVSEGTLYADPTVDIPAGSKITVLGRSTWAITVSLRDDGGLTGLAHVEVALA